MEAGSSVSHFVDTHGWEVIERDMTLMNSSRTGTTVGGRILNGPKPSTSDPCVFYFASICGDVVQFFALLLPIVVGFEGWLLVDLNMPWNDLKFLVQGVSFATLCIFGTFTAMIIVKHLTLGRQRETTASSQLESLRWRQMYHFINGPFLERCLPIIRGSYLLNIVFRILGFNLSVLPDTIIMGRSYDHDMITIGKYSVVNRDCYFTG